MKLKPTSPTPLYSCFLCLGDPEAQEVIEIEHAFDLPLTEAQKRQVDLSRALGPQGARRFEAWVVVRREPVEAA